MVLGRYLMIEHLDPYGMAIGRRPPWDLLWPQNQAIRLIPGPEIFFLGSYCLETTFRG